MPEKNAIAAAMPPRGSKPACSCAAAATSPTAACWTQSSTRSSERLGDIPMRVISGAARGADRMAAEWAASNDVPCDEYAAEWDRYGKSAGYRRNERMLNEGRPHLVVGFPQGESRGTRMMMDIAVQGPGGRRGGRPGLSHYAHRHRRSSTTSQRMARRSADHARQARQAPSRPPA